MSTLLKELEAIERNAEKEQNEIRVSRGRELSMISFTDSTVCNSPVSDQQTASKSVSSFYHHRTASLQDVSVLKTMNKKKKWYQLPISLKRHDSTPLYIQPEKTGFGGLKAGTVEPPSPPPKLTLTLDHSFTTKLNGHTENLPKETSDTLINSMELEKLYINEETVTPCSPTPPYEDLDANKSTINLFLPTLKLKKKIMPQDKTVSAPTTPTSTKSYSSTLPSPASSTQSLSYFENTNVLSSVFTEDTHQLVMNFRNVKPRSTPLVGRPNNSKLEKNALYKWQNQLLETLEQKRFPLQSISHTCEEKKLKNLAVRNFIIDELFSTEITYWNQLNYTKVMHRDPFQLAIQRNSPFVIPSDIDGYANLNDLLCFSSTIILKLKQQSSAGDIHIGSVFRELAEHMVVFLRCAVDYPANRKILDKRQSAKGYSLYNEKLQLRRETRVFTLHDYLIIPIQRIARYELLLADLQKHTEPNHPDAENIRIARYIIHSLASAMDQVQK